MIPDLWRCPSCGLFETHVALTTISISCIFKITWVDEQSLGSLRGSLTDLGHWLSFVKFFGQHEEPWVNEYMSIWSHWWTLTCVIMWPLQALFHQLLPPFHVDQLKGWQQWRHNPHRVGEIDIWRDDSAQKQLLRCTKFMLSAITSEQALSREQLPVSSKVWWLW